MRSWTPGSFSAPQRMVSRARRNHNSAGEWAAHRPPGGQQRLIEEVKRQKAKAKTRPLEPRAERRCEQLLERLPEEPCEQPEKQRRTEVEVEVKVQARIQAPIRVPMQANTRLRIRPEVLPDVQRWVIRETERRVRGESAVCRLQFAGADTRAWPQDPMAIQAPMTRRK